MPSGRLFHVWVTLAVLVSYGLPGARAEDEPCKDAQAAVPSAPGAEAVGEVLAELGESDAGTDPAPPPAPRERRYTIYGYNDTGTSVALTDPDVLSFLDTSGIERLRADDIALGPGGGALAAFSRAYGERFNAFQRAQANRRNERLWKSQYFGAQDEAATLAARIAGLSLPQATEELYGIRPTTNLVIVDPRTTDVPGGILVHSELCVRPGARLDSAYPPFRPDFCAGGRRIAVFGVYTHVFDPENRDWRKRLEMKPIRAMALIIEADGTRRFETAANFAELTRVVAPPAAR